MSDHGHNHIDTSTLVGLGIAGAIIGSEAAKRNQYNQIVAAYIAQGMHHHDAIRAANQYWADTHPVTAWDRVLEVIGTLVMVGFGLFVLMILWFAIFGGSDAGEDDVGLYEVAEPAVPAVVPRAEGSTSGFLAAALRTGPPTDVYMLGDAQSGSRNGISPIDSATLYGPVDGDAIDILHFANGAQADQYVEGSAGYARVLLCERRSSVLFFYGQAQLGDEDYFLSEHCR